MKYLRVFNNDAEYQQFKGGGDYITPNVCLNIETNGIKCTPYTPPVVLITFTFNGTEYQAEEGMTWEEWVNSEYNTLDFFIDGGLVCGNGMWIGYYIVGVTPSDIILNNCIYKSTYISLEGD